MSATVLTGQAPTNLGPLTTTFAPPAACTVAVGARSGLIGNKDDHVAYRGQLCSDNKAVDDTACWPPTSEGAEERSAPLSGWGFYSPGLHCPVGYATACSATGGKGGGSGWPVQFKLGDGETAVGCCPNGYGCANVNGQTCTMVALTTMPTVTCGGGGFAFLTIPNAQASITPLSLFAPMIQINWQSSDRSEPTSTTLPTNTKTGESERVTMSGIRTIDTGVETGIETLNLDTNPPTTGAVTYDFGGGSAATATSSLQEQETSPGSEGGLPSAAKVGLGVAGAAVVLVMLVIALFYCLRKRKNQREEQELDHLYGMRHVASPGSGLTASNDIPGWYRGQKLETPAKDPFRDSTRQVKVPTAPYYPRYRP